MNEDVLFRYLIRKLPDGEALTGSEIEQKLLAKLAANNGECIYSLWELGQMYKDMGRLDQASAYTQRVIELTNDPEILGTGYLVLGQIEEGRGDFVAAAKRYRSALALEPCSTETWYFIHNNLGYSLNQLVSMSRLYPILRTHLRLIHSSQTPTRTSPCPTKPWVILRRLQTCSLPPHRSTRQILDHWIIWMHF